MDSKTTLMAYSIILFCWCIPLNTCNNTTETLQPQQQQQQQQQQQATCKPVVIEVGLSTGLVVMLVILELIVVVLICSMAFRCWYMNKKASMELMNDRTKLTDKSILGRYDET